MTAIDASHRVHDGDLRYQALVEHSPFGVAVHADGVLRYMNEAAARLLGYPSPSELIGRPVTDVIDRELHAVAFERIAAVEGGTAARTQNYRLVRRDGTYVDVEAAAVRTTFEGRPAVHVVVRDITERRRAEDALRESEARFRSLSMASPVGVFQSDVDGSITYANPQVQQIFGMTEAEGRGHGWVARRWTRWASSPAAWRTTSTICSPSSD